MLYSAFQSVMTPQKCPFLWVIYIPM